jgi:hypothetical protein
MCDRLREFSLSLHPEKTRLLEVGRFLVHRRGSVTSPGFSSHDDTTKPRHARGFLCPPSVPNRASLVLKNAQRKNPATGRGCGGVPGPCVRVGQHGKGPPRQRARRCCVPARLVPASAAASSVNHGKGLLPLLLPNSLAHDRTLRRRGWERVSGPKTLTKWHAIERGGMDEGEFQDRCLKPLGHPSDL